MYKPSDEAIQPLEPAFRKIQTNAPIVDDHPNARVVWEAHSAFQAGDIVKLEQCLADDVMWHWPGENVLKADLVGREAVVKHFDVLFKHVDSYWAQGLRYIGGTDFGFLIAYVTATRGEHKLQVPECLVFRIVDEKIHECWHMALDEMKWDEFFRHD